LAREAPHSNISAKKTRKYQNGVLTEFIQC